ncbi:leucyl aminopeptidase [Robiginitomaculum antarcticum]|uniref:leucyl aminopeptidase n=1 Tax=Robiginitomaculum antarcticum TaxID=437507 RepID=UPI000366D370|nr:leucyl aminopeptidase [Robiginitomaculum antarcticum]
MKISFVSSAQASGAAVIFSNDKANLTAGGAHYDGDVIAAAIRAAKFTGKSRQTLSVYAPKGTNTTRALLMGIADGKKFDPETSTANAVKTLLLSGETKLTVHLEGMGISPDDQARAALGGRLAAYRFDNYRTKLKDDQKPTLKSLKIACDSPAKAKAAYDAFYGPVGDGTYTARDLVSEPPNMLHPKTYSARIKKMTDMGLKVDVLGEKKMKTLGMHALLGVGLGSAHESQVAIMHWEGGKKDDKPICLIGKGVTFDSGGISLKPGAGMWDMKGDMGGSAAVVGAMEALAKRKAKANVIGLVGLVENMPDALAQRPGDIVTSMSGQTIEVQNTDAEGRLVLCDVLHYARTKYDPRVMVDLATLTGAILVSLGHEHGGLFSNSDEVADGLLGASVASTEKLWRMPMSKAYDKLLDSNCADMKNIGGRLAGSITAAQFLQRFVGDTPWAHLDIAGTAWKGTSTDPREPAWATGFGVRLLNQWVKDKFEG